MFSAATKVRVVILCWLFVALVAGESHLLALIPPPGPQLLIASLTLAVLVAYQAWPALHEWLDQLGTRPIVALHISRFVGLYFIFLYSQGRLPYDFAVPGGIGDCAVALGALLIVLWPGRIMHRRVIKLWNVFGLVDILYVVFTAGRLAFKNPEVMGALYVLPLSLLPLFLVPLIISTHLILFVRLSSLAEDAQVSTLPPR